MVGGGAAETMSLHHHGAERIARLLSGCERQGGQRAELDDTPKDAFDRVDHEIWRTLWQ